MTLPLFDRPTSPARRSDPETSHLAASANVSARAVHRRMALRAHYEARATGLTDFELEAATGIKQTSIGKRRKDLMDYSPPLIEMTDERRAAPSGPTAVVWKITAAGVASYLAQTEK